MPIASGAAGRVGVVTQVDTSTPRTSDGLRRKTEPANRNCDSYLQRYQELKQRKNNKSNLCQGIQDNTDPSDNENNGAKEKTPEGNGSSGIPSSSHGTIFVQNTGWGSQSLLLLLSSPTTMLLYCFCCSSLNDSFTFALFRPPSLQRQTGCDRT
ncbi:hypothetical protein FQN60_018107, partial [Etheostoma spectabile]